MAYTYQYDTLQVPIELVKYAHFNKLHKALGIYLLLKASCNGHLVLSSEHRSFMMADLGLKTVRSFEKHLQKLIQLNWVGIDKNSRTYYIRSFKTQRRLNGFYLYRAVSFCVLKDSANITQFVQAAIICSEVVRRKRARKAKIIKEAGRSARKKERAVQELITSRRITPYTGLSNESLGKLLAVSKSQADRLKKRLVGTGYIGTNAKYHQVFSFDNPDYFFLKHLRPDRRYRLEVTGQGDAKTYTVLERSYDEILSYMEFCNQKSVVRRLKKENSNA